MRKICLLLIISALLLSSCQALGGFFPTSTPTPTATVTLTPTMTFTPTITVTPSPTFTLTPSPTPVELGADGLPIFPEKSVSRGDNIEISFSQGVLNDLGVQTITFPEETANNIRQMLIGQWLYIRGAPGFGRINAKNLDDLIRANAKSDGIGVQIETQYFNINPEKTVIQIEFVRGCRDAQLSEFKKIEAALKQQPNGHVLSRNYSRWGGNDLGGSRGILGVTYYDSYHIRFVNYVDCYKIKKYVYQPYLAVADMFHGSTILSYSAIHGNYLGRVPNMELESIVYSYTSARIGLTVLGGCQATDVAACKEGTEKWNFSVLP